MKNKYFKTLFLINLILINLIFLANSDEEFQFNITEIEINKNGNLIIGKKGGKAKTIDGYEIIGKNFIYNKKTNTLIVSGNVKMYSTINDTIIFSDKALILKMMKLLLQKVIQRLRVRIILLRQLNLSTIKNKIL